MTVNETLLLFTSRAAKPCIARRTNTMVMMLLVIRDAAAVIFARIP